MTVRRGAAIAATAHSRADHLIDLKQFSASLGQSHGDAGEPIPRPPVAAAQRRRLAAAIPGRITEHDLAVLADHRVRLGFALEPRAIFPFKRTVLALAVAQTPLVSRRPEEGVASRTLHRGDAAFQPVLRRIRREVLGRHPRCDAFPTPERYDQRHALEVPGPVLVEPRLDALRLGQPLAAKPHLRRTLLQPGGQIVAFGQPLHTPRLLRGPRFVDGRRIAPVGRGSSRTAKHAGHYGERQGKGFLQVVPHRVSPAEDQAVGCPYGEQGFGMPRVILAIRHHAAFRGVVAPELRRQTAGLRAGGRSPRLPEVRAFQHAAFRRAENQRIACAVALKRGCQRQQRIIHAFHERARFALHLDAKPEPPLRPGFHDADSRQVRLSNPLESQRQALALDATDRLRIARGQFQRLSRIAARRDHDQTEQLLVLPGQLQLCSRIRQTNGRTGRAIQAQDGIPAADFEHLRPADTRQTAQQRKTGGKSKRW